MSKPILFFGNEQLATGVKTRALVFSGLIAAGYDIKALIVSQKDPKALNDLEVVKLARNHGINVLNYTNLKQAAADIAKFEVDVAVLVAYGRIIPKEILDIFKVGIINVHPSLLPIHRGPTPIESVILNGDKTTGVSIMHLELAMDVGPIYCQQSLALSGDETKQQLGDSLDALASKLLIENLDDIISRKLTANEQPSKGVTYDRLIKKTDGMINWNESWQQIERKLRAYSIWPGLRSSLNGLNITLLKIHKESASGQPGEYINYDGQLAVYCSDSLVLIDELIPAGSKQMSGVDFIRGYGKRLLN